MFKIPSPQNKRHLFQKMTQRTRTFAYDTTFNLTGETLGSRTINYTYSTSGVKGRYTGMSGNHTYSYDQYGRINQINDITYTRLTNNELIAQVNRPNEINSVYGYEANRDIALKPQGNSSGQS